VKVELTLEIHDLHADPSDRPPKKHRVPKDVFSQIDVTTTEEEINEEASMKSEKAKKEEKKRTQVMPLYAFLDDFTYRLGGPYGKLMGLFKEAGSSLYSQKVEGFKVGYKSFLRSLLVKPQRVQLEDVENKMISKIPQIVSGRSRAFILLYYEKIGKCKAQVTIEMPQGVKEKFKRLIEQCEGMPFGPKRRGEIKVLDMKWHS